MGETVGWGIQLWDTFRPNVYDFLKYNLDFWDTYRTFLKQRAKIEETYSKELKKLAQSVRCKSYSKQDSSIVFTVQKVFDSLLDELTAYSNQHEALHDFLVDSEKVVKGSCKEMKKEKDDVENKVSSLTREMEKRQKHMESLKQKYNAAFSAYKIANADYERTSQDRNLAPVEIDRFKNVYDQRKTAFDESEQNYAKSVSDMNNCMEDYFSKQLPSNLSTLENLERRFVCQSSGYFKNWIEQESMCLKVQQTCVDSMAQAVESVSADTDVLTFVTVTQSGNQPLPPFDYERLSFEPGRSSSENSLNHTGAGGGKKSGIGSLFGTWRGGKGNDGPAQQRRRLQKEIQEKEKVYEKIRNQVDGLKKMQTMSPAQGFDAKQIQGELSALEGQLSSLVSELTELKDLILNYNSNNSPPAPIPRSNLQKSRSVTSLNEKKKKLRLLFPKRSPSPTRHHHRNRLASLNGESATTLPAQQAFQQQPQQVNKTDNNVPTQQLTQQPPALSNAFDDEFDSPTTQTAPPLPPAPPAPPAASSQQLATVMYEFMDNSQPDNLLVREGEQLVIIMSEPDGWTKARRVNTNEEGYVPTAYLEMP